MKIGRLIKTAIKFAPVIYPIVRKVISQKKGTNTTIPKK